MQYYDNSYYPQTLSESVIERLLKSGETGKPIVTLPTIKTEISLDKETKQTFLQFGAMIGGGVGLGIIISNLIK